MAQAIFEHLSPRLYAQSAGKYTSFVRPEVRTVLDEIGILSKGYHSKDEVAIDWTDVSLYSSVTQIGPPLRPAAFQNGSGCSLIHLLLQKKNGSKPVAL